MNIFYYFASSLPKFCQALEFRNHTKVFPDSYSNLQRNPMDFPASQKADPEYNQLVSLNSGRRLYDHWPEPWSLQHMPIFVLLDWREVLRGAQDGF